MSTYARAKYPTPVYNTFQIPHHQSALSRDHQGLIKSIEFIAFTNTLFTCHKEVAPQIIQVSTNEYPSSEPLYVDHRFLSEAPMYSLERQKELPSSDIMIQWMMSLVGTRYFWGGNWAQGIPEMLNLYSHLTPSEDLDDVSCKGVDCSGLLYQASDGVIPRNTSQLINYGNAIVADLNSPMEVKKVLRPLDMIVWKGHVVFSLNSEEVIESRLGAGVIISPFLKRYCEILEKTATENKTLYLRRWHPDFLV